MNGGTNWLDVRLGVRMLIKYPGLTLVGALGMSVAIALGAGSFTFFYSYMNPTLPLDEGERVVAIENWDAAASHREDRTLHDFVTWRDELKSIQDLGAYREIARNLVTADGVSERVRIAEMTASGFRLARVPPLFGRPLLDDDERKGALPVIVIGHDAWRTHFDADPAIVGQAVRLGNAGYAVVGVMPAGFAFPVYHDFWVPLQAAPSDYERRQLDGWYEIVGVVGDFPASATELSSADARMYHPVTLGEIYPASVAARVRGTTPARVAGRLREITTSIDPALQLDGVLSLDQVYGREQRFVRMGALAFGTVTLSILLLSAAGIYALMSFTVAQRRREIGIRTALGADPRRILAGIFARALRQLAIGVSVGLVVAALLFEEITDSAVLSGHGAILLTAVAVMMTAIGLLASVGPVRRGLQIDPAESLKADG